MPTYLTPGVYVEEVPSTSKPIEGVGTSIAAFVGLAPGGPVNTPMRISNWTQFTKIYGDPNSPTTARSWRARTWRTRSTASRTAGACAGSCASARPATPRGPGGAPAAADRSVEAFRVEAIGDGNGSVKVEIIEEPSAGEGAEPTYKLVVDAGAAGKEEYEGLTLKKGRQNLATKVNSASKFVKITEAAGLPDARPATGSYTLSAPSSSAEDLSAGDFEGDVARRKGMGGLAAVDEITMVCMPDAMTLANGGGGDDAQLRDLQGKMIAHCEGAGDRMAILDAPPNLLPQEILEWRMNTAGYDSKFATLYYPWIEVMDPLTNQPMLVPPSSHVAGVWCRTDASRGVHKAPANEVVGVNGLGFQVTQGEQGGLNKVGINCIRSFPGRGIRIWGARTLSSDPEWRYINVRRLFNYIAESIMEGTQWSVFEPNDERLWMQLRIAASNFLPARGARARCSAQRPSRPSSSSATRRPTRPT